MDPGHNRLNFTHTREIRRLVNAGGFEKACNTTGTEGDDGWPEATFNWEMALALRSDLEALGARVVLTRQSNDGWGPCINDRGRTGAINHADALVSIHGDGAPSSGRGFDVIHPSLDPGYTDGTTTSSTALATVVRDQLVRAGLRPANYVGLGGLDQRGDLGTLNRAGVPAVMIECGNMRNSTDLAAMHDAGWRARAAAAIARAVQAFVVPPAKGATP